MTPSLAHKIITRGFWLYFFTVLMIPATYGTRILIADTLSVADIGILYSVISFVMILTTFNDGGLSEAANYFIPKYRVAGQHDHVTTILKMNLWVQGWFALAIGGLLWLGAGWLGSSYFHSAVAAGVIFPPFAIYLFFAVFFTLFTNIFLSLQDAFASKFFEFLKAILTVLFVSILWLYGSHDILSYAWAWVLGTVIATACMAYGLHSRYPYLMTRGVWVRDKTLIDEYFGYAYFIFLGAGAGAIFTQMDQQAVMYFLSATEAGYYASFLSLLGIAGLFVFPLLGFLFPVVSDLMFRDDRPRIREVFRVLYNGFFVLGIGLSGCFLVFGPDIARIIFGANFIHSGEILQIAAPFIVLFWFSILDFTLLSALGRAKERYKILLWTLVVSLFANLLLVPKFGTTGAVLSIVIGWSMMHGLAHPIIRAYEPVAWERSILVRNTLATLLFAGGTWCIHASIITWGRIHDLFVISFVGVIYLLLLMVMNRPIVQTLADEIRKILHS